MQNNMNINPFGTNNIYTNKKPKTMKGNQSYGLSFGANENVGYDNYQSSAQKKEESFWEKWKNVIIAGTVTVGAVVLGVVGYNKGWFGKIKKWFGKTEIKAVKETENPVEVVKDEISKHLETLKLGSLEIGDKKLTDLLKQNNKTVTKEQFDTVVKEIKKKGNLPDNVKQAAVAVLERLRKNLKENFKINEFDTTQKIRDVNVLDAILKEPSPAPPQGKVPDVEIPETTLADPVVSPVQPVGQEQPVVPPVVPAQPAVLENSEPKEVKNPEIEDDSLSEVFEERPEVEEPVETEDEDDLSDISDETSEAEELVEVVAEADLSIDDAFDESEPIKNKEVVSNVGGGQSLPPIVPETQKNQPVVEPAKQPVVPSVPPVVPAQPAVLENSEPKEVKNPEIEDDSLSEVFEERPEVEEPVETEDEDDLSDISDETSEAEELVEVVAEADLSIDDAFDESEPIKNKEVVSNVGGGQSLPPIVPETQKNQPVVEPAKQPVVPSVPPVVPVVPETKPSVTHEVNESQPVVPEEPVAQTATAEEKQAFNKKLLELNAKMLDRQRFGRKRITAEEVKELFGLWHDGVINDINATIVAGVLETAIKEDVFKTEPEILKDHIKKFLTVCVQYSYQKTYKVCDVLIAAIEKDVFKNDLTSLKGYISKFINALIVAIEKDVYQESCLDQDTCKKIDEMKKATYKSNVANILKAAIESKKFESNWLYDHILEFIDAFDKHDNEISKVLVVLILAKAIEKDLDKKDLLDKLKNRIPNFIELCLDNKYDIVNNTKSIKCVLSVAIKNNLLNQELHSQVQQIYDKLEQRRLYFMDNEDEEQIRIKEWLNLYKTTV